MPKTVRGYGSNPSFDEATRAETHHLLQMAAGNVSAARDELKDIPDRRIETLRAALLRMEKRLDREAHRFDVTPAGQRNKEEAP